MDVNGVSIKMPTDSFRTLAGTGDITVSLDKATGIKDNRVLDKLSESNKRVAEKAVVVEVSFTTNGSVSDLGTVTIAVPYTPASGQSADTIVAYYISDTGELTEMTSSYTDGMVIIETTHFSTFAVCSDSLTAEPGSGGMNMGLIIGGAVGAVAVIGIAVFLIKRR